MHINLLISNSAGFASHLYWRVINQDVINLEAENIFRIQVLIFNEKKCSLANVFLNNYKR